MPTHRCDTTSGKASREVEQLKKQVAQLQKARSRSPRGAKGSRKSSRSYPAPQDSTLQASIKGKGGRTKGVKGNKGGGGKGKSTYRSFCRSRQTKVGTWFSTSTTRRILDSASFSKAGLARNRNACSTTTVQVAIKWEYRTKIASAWLTSEEGPHRTLDWSRSFPTWCRIVENLTAYCWSHTVLSMVLSYWKVGAHNRTSSETAGLAS